MSHPSSFKNRNLEYPETTDGSIAAAKARNETNALSRFQRQNLFARGMQIINNPMNRNISKLFVLWSIVIGLGVGSMVVNTGCNGNQQSIAYKSLYSVEKATTGAYDGYIQGILLGKVSTNDLPAISRAYNKFQASTLVALDAVQYSTNALAPTSLIIESSDIINLINQTTKKGK